MRISASHVWLTPVESKEALLTICSRVLETLNASSSATIRVRSGALPEKSRAFGETFSTIEEASAVFRARQDAEFEFSLKVEDRTLQFSASFRGMIPSISLYGGSEGGLSPLVEKYRLTDTIDGLYHFADYPGGPYSYVRNARFFDLLLSRGGFEHPVLTSWDKVLAMYRLLNAVLDRIGVYERLDLCPASCLERRDYKLIYSSYARVVISDCLKDAGKNGPVIDIYDLNTQSVELTGRTLYEIYEKEYDEESFVYREIDLDPEFVDDLVEDDPKFAALLARNIPKFAALLDQALSNRGNAVDEEKR